MQIPRSYVENYSKALNVVSDRARAALVDALSQIDYSADVATIREAVIAIMQPACGASSTMAARLAADFYDGLRARFGIDDGFVAEVDAQREPEATEGAVRAFSHELDNSIPNVSEFQRLCVDRIDYETRLAANKCVEYNAKRDPRKPRWARIPTGAETCSFCIMLASRGFVYHSEETASHAHAHCDCRIVPSWDKSPLVQGYDPDKYYDMWKHPENYPPASFEATSNNSPKWARDLNVSVSERDIGLPSGQRNTTLRTARCDVYTTDDGIEVIFPQGINTTKQDMTPQHAIELLNRVPAEIRTNMQRQVFFVDYENPQDAYWRARYSNFTRSYATGGDEITFYMWTGHDDDYVVRSYCHEAGHYIDKQNGDISNTQTWDDARTADMQISGRSSPTAYGNNSNVEDFAESVAEWATNRADFSVQYPQRTSILVNLIT